MAGVSDENKELIIRRFGLDVGSLPVRYLGLPLVPKQLSQNDYKPLIEKIRTRTSSWSTRPLSFAGRLQLLVSVIGSLINFWIAAFRLPKGCVQELESICSAFLWSGPDLNPRKAKLAWKDVCKPKDEGGLGLKSIEEANKVCILKLIWRLETTPSLWRKWVRENNLKKRSFWAVDNSSSAGSWIWKKMLKYRALARSFYRVQVGNGHNTSFWFDDWSQQGVLFEVLGPRGCIDMGIPLEATVHEVIQRTVRRRHQNPFLVQLEQTIEDHRRGSRIHDDDSPLWRYKGDIFKPVFSTKETWNQIRGTSQKTEWSKGIWFSFSTPKYSFMAWLAMHDRLSTGERMDKWNVGARISCVLCSEPVETKEHLFFSCAYSKKIWSDLVQGILEDDFTTSWDEIVLLLTSRGRSRLALFAIRYAFQLSIHSIWRERNCRRHGDKHTEANTLSKWLDKVVRNRLITMMEGGDTKHKDALVFWFSTRL